MPLVVLMTVACTSGQRAPVARHAEALSAPHSAVQAAPDSLLARMDSVVRAEMTRQRIPGVAAAIVEGGQVRLMRGWGFANLEHHVPVTAETIFQSGSLGKPFTASLVMALVADGVLSLDAPVGNYLGDVPDAWRGITLRHLLTHTSGLGRYPEGFDFRRDYDDEQLLAFVKTLPLVTPPGAEWTYSNPGYVLLGIVIRKATGRFYGDLLRERFFAPLGMASARVISEAEIVPHRAAGYVLENSEWRNQAWVSPTINTTADGSLYLSLRDVVAWNAGIREGRPLAGDVLEQMWTPVRLADGRIWPNYGIGWGLPSFGGRRGVAHAGSWQGFSSLFVRYPEDDLSVVVFTNLGSAQTTDIVLGLVRILRPDLAVAPQ